MLLLTSNRDGVGHKPHGGRVTRDRRRRVLRLFEARREYFRSRVSGVFMATNPVGEARLRLLGPVVAVHEDQLVASPSVMVRTLLALLALHAGSPVTTTVIIEELWGASLPKDPRSALQVLAARLRKWLPSAGLEASALRYEQDSYVLDVPDHQVDVARFVNDVTAAMKGRADATVRLAAAERALVWWRGEPFSGCVPGVLLETEAARLDELRLSVEELRHEMMLALGRHNEIIADLGALIARYPARERLAKLAMLALYRADRQHEALAVFQTVRRHLAEEYGLDVSADLVELEAKILAQDDQLLFAQKASVEVTLVFTDIEGSTALAHELGDKYVDVLSEHNRIMRDAIERYRGDEISNEGDSFFAVFGSAEDAVNACLAAQLELERHPWSHGRPVRARMGIHTGTAIRLDRDFAGLNVHLASRISAAGHGGQVLASQQTLDDLTADDRRSWIDLGEHGLKDFPDPIRLYQLAHPELTASFPELRTSDVHGHNLPAPVTSFVGRTPDLAALRARLSGDARLITVTGAGGIGKTRLALEAAWSVLRRFRGGAWFVDFSSVTDPAGIVDVIASTLDVSDRDGATRAALIAEKVGGAPSLFLLDNLEHLLSGVVSVSALLAACPSLVVLATSRERLRLQGEYEISLGGLAVADAVELFVARAAMSGHDVTPDEHVELLCHRVDGVPLALELAAARLRTHSVEQLVAAMDRMLDTLGEGERDRPLRHQAMRAAIAVSVDALTEAERSVFRAFAVFGSGATAEAIAAVCAPKADEVASLVEKSLLRATGDRFVMLEPIRQYAEERLAIDVPGERELRTGAHAAYFLGLAERLEPELVSARQAEVLDQFAADHTNFRIAIERGEADTPLRVAAAMARFWIIRGHTYDGRAVLAEVLATHPSAAPHLRAGALLGAGNLALLQNDLPSARRDLEAVIAIGTPAQAGDACNLLGGAALQQGDLSAADDYYLQARWYADASGDESIFAAARNGEGFVATRRGEFEAAAAAFRDAYEMAAGRGELQGALRALGNLGVALMSQGVVAEATEAFERSLELARETGSRGSEAAALQNLAWATQVAAPDNHAQVEKYLQAAIAIYDELGYRRELANALIELVAVPRDEADGLAALARAESLLRELGDDAGVSRVAQFREHFLESCD
jgi:predicted ATPase/class 3 adenylate cyclase/Tfp pilus assembly protein PilF